MCILKLVLRTVIDLRLQKLRNSTWTLRSFSLALLLVRLTSMVLLFFGTAIHKMLSKNPGGCSSSFGGCGRSPGPFTAKAGTTHTRTHVSKD